MNGPTISLHIDPAAGPSGRHDRGVAAVAARPAGSARRLHLTLLTWAFAVFNSVRVFSYLPTLWAIHTSGDSSQHSLVTWLTWLGANATMALWLYEHNGQRCNRAVMVNVGNAVMCLATSVLITWHRFRARLPSTPTPRVAPTPRARHRPAGRP